MSQTLITLLCCVAVCLLVAQTSASVLRQKRSTLTDDAERILKQGNNIDVNNVGQLIDLVERNKADECLARVVCELSHNTKAHGESGVRFAQALLKFRQNKHPKIRYYTEAMANGAKAKKNEQCRGHYPNCSYPTAEIIGVGNKILRTK